MKTKLLFISVFLLAITESFGQTVVERKTLPLYEGFNYDFGTKLFNEGQIGGQGGWQMFNANAVAAVASNPILVDSPVWNMGGLPAPQPNNALNFWSGNDDPHLHFTDQGTAFTIYSSFIFKIPTLVDPQVDYWTDTVGDYIYSFGKTSTTNTVNYTSNVFLRKTSPTTFNIGLAENNTNTPVNYSSTVFNYDQDIVVVIKYSTDGTAAGSISSMWINPTISSTEPAALLTTASDGLQTTPTGARTNLDKIRINKSNQAKTPNIILDEIRVANTWYEVVGQSAPLGVAKNEIENLKVYPNPVSNGILNINTSDNSNAKNVTVYDLLGKVVLNKKLTANTLDVSAVSKGSYIVKIDQGDKSSSKKVVIE